MKLLSDGSLQSLEWTQPSTFERLHELRAGGELVAQLRWLKLFGSLAAAESAAGSWTFKRSGFLSPAVTARLADSETEVATIRPNWRGEGILECGNGNRYRWAKPSFWRSDWNFTNEAEEPLVRISPRLALLKQSAEVAVSPGSLANPDLSLLTLLGWYLMVMMAHDSGGAGGAAAAAG